MHVLEAYRAQPFVELGRESRVCPWQLDRRVEAWLVMAVVVVVVMMAIVMAIVMVMVMMMAMVMAMVMMARMARMVVVVGSGQLIGQRSTDGEC